MQLLTRRTSKGLRCGPDVLLMDFEKIVGRISDKLTDETLCGFYAFPEEGRAPEELNDSTVASWGRQLDLASLTFHV